MTDGTSHPQVCIARFDPERHLQKLRMWLHRPHVSRWWGEPEAALEDARRRPPETCAIVVADGRDVGYLCWQTPGRDELENAGLADLPEGLVDIDVFIGESGWLGRGIGSRSLVLLLERLEADPGVSVAGVGTAVSNVRAIRAFEKAGFWPFREFQDTDSGPCVYMVAELRRGAARPPPGGPGRAAGAARLTPKDGQTAFP